MTGHKWPDFYRYKLHRYRSNRFRSVSGAWAGSCGLVSNAGCSRISSYGTSVVAAVVVEYWTGIPFDNSHRATPWASARAPPATPAYPSLTAKRRVAKLRAGPTPGKCLIPKLQIASRLRLLSLWRALVLRQILTPGRRPGSAVIGHLAGCILSQTPSTWLRHSDLADCLCQSSLAFSFFNVSEQKHWFHWCRTTNGYAIV